MKKRRRQENQAVSENISTYFTTRFGESFLEKYYAFLDTVHVQTIRVNTLKISREQLRQRLADFYGIGSEPVDGVPYALTLNDNDDIAGKTLEHALGYYYIQSLSSMIPPLLVNPQPGERVLDLCAAPGSKSTALSEMMQNKGMLALNEIQGNRVGPLIFNLDRMNVTNAGVIHMPGELLSGYYHEYFDRILVDAPCSALGILRKKGEVNNWWNSQSVSRLSQIQYKLLVSAFKMLRPGGTLVYSTCTLTYEENEGVVNELLKRYPVEPEAVEPPVPSSEGFTRYGDEAFDERVALGRRILPWEADSEGFFVIRLRKTDTLERQKEREAPASKHRLDGYSKLSKHFQRIVEDFGVDVRTFDNYRFVTSKNQVHFVDRLWDGHNAGLYHRIGAKFGSFDSAEQIILSTHAAQQLAGSFSRNIINLDDEQRIKRYLEGGLIKGDFGPPGQYAVSYKGLIVGTGLVNKEGFKSRFPRVHRTHEVLLPQK